MPPYPVNLNLINYQDFFVSAESVGLNTSVRGTVFVNGNIEKPRERNIQISAWVEVDPNDWGGVGFYINQPWKVTEVSTDYPQKNPRPEEQFAITTSGDTKLFFTIGHSKFSSAGGGGQGVVIVELSPSSLEQDLPENLEMTIGVGSKGDNIQNPVYKTIKIPLNVDYRTIRQPLEVVSVVGPLSPVNPGGPVVEITLKNVSSQSVTSLSAALRLDSTFNFNFEVTSSNPLLPAKIISAKLTLINGGFSDTISYPLMINGTLQNGATFAYTRPVVIVKP